MNIKKDEIDPSSISKYVTYISCRPRESVIQEILTHSSSLEENLQKLEIAGDLISFNSELFDKQDIHLNNNKVLIL